MTTAFDRVSQSVSARINDNEDLRQALALIILRLVDEGQRAPERVADIAFREWTGADRFGDQGPLGGGMT